MKDGRLHLRFDEKLLKAARKVCERRGTTLTAVVTEFLHTLVEQDRLWDKLVRGFTPDADQA